jgi:tight adherence protein C
MSSLVAILNDGALFAVGLVSLQVSASAMVGAAIGLSGWWVFQVLRSEDLQQGAEWRYDISRINELRRLDLFYRLFHPAIQRMARVNRTVFREGLPEVQRQIQAAGLPRFWLPEEYLARIEILALFTIPIYSYLFFSWFGGGGLLVAFGAVMATAWFLRLRLAGRAKRRLYLIKRRMPFLLDLLTLLMEAGSTFLNAIAQAVDEFRGHPVAEEFGRVLSDMNMGKTRVEAFEAMRDRLADDEITSIIGAILQGEYLGTPLGKIFRTQADVLRLKRTQRAEVVAGEAGVNMLLPGILIMVATVLIIVGPFMLNYLRFGMTM